MDSSEEWEEEEEILIAELHGILEPDFLQTAEGNCKVLGIGTETPYLQVDGYTFSGKYVAPLGTYIIMEEKDPSSEDIKTDVRKGKECAKLEYITCLDKKLDLNRAFISPKETKETGSTTSSYTSEIPNTSTAGSQETQQSSNTPENTDNNHGNVDRPSTMETGSEVT
ncbi:general transcription factor 3C polypeptide 6 isoform X1 [Magallana gigas]|uniref:general transcription factor 3C polypeptide 6 isoform X1 n=1 Tax=Magallana gigas TaxID=29159 RepID=UPI00333FEC86